MDSILNGIDSDPLSFPSLTCTSLHQIEDHSRQNTPQPDNYPLGLPRFFAEHVEKPHLTDSSLHVRPLSTGIHSPLSSGAGHFRLDFFGSHSNYTYRRPTSSSLGHHLERLDSAVDPGCIHSVSCRFQNDPIFSAPRSLPSAPLEHLSAPSYTATLLSTGSSSSFTDPSLSQTLDASLLQYHPLILSQIKSLDYFSGSIPEPAPFCVDTGTIESQEANTEQDLAKKDRLLQQLIRGANLFSSLEENSLHEAPECDRALADESLTDEDYLDELSTSLDNELDATEYSGGLSIAQELVSPQPALPSTQPSQVEKREARPDPKPRRAPTPRKAGVTTCTYHKTRLLRSYSSRAWIGHTPIWVTFHFTPPVFRAISDVLAADYRADSRGRQPLTLPPPFTADYYALRRTTFISIAACSKNPRYRPESMEVKKNDQRTLAPTPQPMKTPSTKKNRKAATEPSEYEGSFTVKTPPSFYENDAKTDRYYSRLNIYELSRVLGLQNFSIKLTRDIEFNILEMFRSYCNFQIGLQTWVRGATKDQRSALIDRLATVVRPFYPEFTKFQLEIIVRRASYSLMQSRLRRRRRIMRNITKHKC